MAALVAALLSACKFGKSDDSADRPLPPPEPPAPDAGPPLEPAATDEAPRRPAAPREKPRTNTDTEAPAEPAAAPTATATATATEDAGSSPPSPSATATVPDLQDKAIACMNKCQTSLSGCMSKPVALDGGMPDMSAMSECKKAFDECRAACSP